MLRWRCDLMLGVRLAVGGGRAGWGRLALTAVGVGLGVTVLLAATSVSHILQAHDDRGYARGIPNDDAKPIAVPGIDRVYAACGTAGSTTATSTDTSCRRPAGTRRCRPVSTGCQTLARWCFPRRCRIC